MTRLVALLVLGALAAGNAISVEQKLGPDEVGVSAPARITYSLDAKPKVERLDFSFRTDDSHAWINDDGDYHVGGWIKHTGFRCADYSMGVRFGAGSPGCLNVKWITGPLYVTSESQCNDARVEHTGDNADTGLGERLAIISCAQRVIRCTGNCR